MADLSHWDFAEQFSGYEAAALILGVEPRGSDDKEWRVQVVVDRMALHYNHALYRYHHEAFGATPDNDVENNRPFELESVAMDLLRQQCPYWDEETQFSNWLAGDASNFEKQLFSRQEVARWLEAIGMKPIHKFKRFNALQCLYKVHQEGYLKRKNNLKNICKE